MFFAFIIALLLSLLLFVALPMLAVGGHAVIALVLIAVFVGFSSLLIFYGRHGSDGFILFCLLISLFGPPTLVLNHPLEIAGLSLLPVYVVSVFIAVFCLVISLLRDKGFCPKALVYLVFLLGVALVSSMIGLDPTHSLKKCVILFLCMIVFYAFNYLGRISKEKWRISFLCIVVIAFFQFYQGITSIFFVGDNFFWFRFEPLQWLRLGAGYQGYFFNPQRLYAMFFDPNYVPPIMILLLLVVLSSSIGFRIKAIVSLLVVCSILATLSLQGILIGLIVMGLHLTARMGIRLLEGVTLVVLFFLVPFLLYLLYWLVNLAIFPDPHISSMAERIYILAASAKAFAENPMGIGLGNFAKYGFLFYPDDAKRFAVSHGWHYELLIHLGLFGYLAFSGFFLDIYRHINYHGKLAMWAIFFWGLTSPGLLTWYLWLFLGLICGFFKKSVEEIERDQMLDALVKSRKLNF